MTIRRAYVAIAVGWVVACSHDVTAPPASPLRPLYYLKAPTNNGDRQTDTVLKTLALPFRVLVRRGDTPAPGVTVKWEILGDTLIGVPSFADTTLTDASGIATSSFRLTLGSVAGAYAVRASVPGAPTPAPIMFLTDAPCGSALCFTATALPSRPALLRYISGDGQIDTVNTTLEQDYVVQATDNYGNGVPGVAVNWAVTAGGGSIAPAQSITTAPNGEARARRTLGPTDETQTASATAPGLPDALPVTFTTTGFSLLPVASVTVTPESVTVATDRTARLSAVLRDSLGRLLIWRHINWTTDDPTIATVDTTGLVRGTSPGRTRVVAESEGVSDTAVVTVIPGPPPALFAALVAGAYHTCGLRGDGTAYCWGGNQSGQLGNGSFIDSPTPVAVAGGHNFTVLVSGFEHTCGLTDSGTAYCWGRNDDGELGDGTFAAKSNPVAVTGYTFATIGTGAYTTCGVSTAGTAYCWGWNDWGQLGNGSFSSRSRPVAFAASLRFASIGGGFGWHTCGVTDAGAAYCWGYGFDGELGDGSFDLNPLPVAVSGNLTFTKIATGPFHTCALTTAGVVNCWGDNHWGELGDDANTFQRSAPGSIAGGVTASSVISGGGHSCEVSNTGEAYCWGRNDFGQLGDGSTIERATPVRVFGGYTFRTLAGGGDHTCGLLNSGAAYCWGNNGAGQLGDGTTTSSPLPVRVVNP